ncbi:L-fuconolactonase [Pseudomonas taetrolens]|uniref:Amidohydrolase n=1 Tax=Pseudomonas taetrolens TaxID=47884 RepID=A0A0J6GN90_PSETA|nr:amidohydrolase family protein [Pseudomonas taetrolens]KMM86166.1 amidohydrolase [Pseudomonas taetrolens]SEC94583.1 L-fuconolactonase [Pseudomonas taetrolens]SQF87493.1 amidohydrolase 2 [Pseudomonas taetrolens]VEH50686.1 amidohydrolase 2 [Pseudomonas taetrolens]
MSSRHSLRLDAHQHFWRYDTASYPWIGQDMPCLRQDFQPDDLRPLLDAAGFDGCIAVQARACESETDQLLLLAERYPWIRAVVGWVDLCASDLEQSLERWAQAPALRGFRHQLQDETSPAGFMQKAEFQRGLATLQRQGLVYEVLVKAKDLGAVTALCHQHDRHHLVLDHLGKPDVQGNDLNAWAKQLAPLAALSHVSCKLSGLITEAHWQHWHNAQLTPYLETALELFGPERLMFGSDWPVCLLASDYQATCSLVGSVSQHAAIWGETACRVYNIEGTTR